MLKRNAHLERNHAAKVNHSTTFHVNNMLDTNKLTCHALLAHHFKSRPLLDSGSQISIIKESIFNTLPARFRRLQPSSVKVQSASGDSLKVIGSAVIPIKLGNSHFTHRFIIISQIRHPVILGTDFLVRNNATLDFARRVLSIGQDDVELLGLSQVISKGRMNHNVHIAPQTTSFIYIRPKRNYINPSACYQISSADTPLLDKEPGLFLLNSCSHVHKNNLIPAILVNTTGRHFHIRKGNVIAHLTPIDQEHSVNTVTYAHPPSPSDLHSDADPKYDIANLKTDHIPQEHR